jgi:Rrf2 family protein
MENDAFSGVKPIGFVEYPAAMISQKARYALRALLFLAARDENAPVQISEIAESERIPRKFLEAILLELKKPGIVQSHRGRAGGYSLGRPAKDISFADVLRVTDGPLALSPCVSVMAYRKCDDCFEETVCAIRKALLAARDATAQILETRNLATAARQLRKVGAL